MIKECALCDIEITQENDTKEHIIPNAIGGRKKVKGFICDNCNNKSGYVWESDLAKQLNPLSLFFGINRERKDVPSQVFDTTGGKKVILKADGKMSHVKPEYIEIPSESGVHFNISARNKKEAKKILQGIKRKYPEFDLDIDDLMQNAKTNSSYLSDMIQFKLELGGLTAGRSIVKSAFALAVDAGVDAKACEHARAYLLGDDNNPCFGYYYENDLIMNRPEGIPLHCVYVHGIPETKQLLGYVEFFGAQRMVLCLSSKYEGAEFTNCYAMNPIDGKEMNITVDLNLTPEDIKAAYNYERYSGDAIQNAFNKVIATRQKSSAEQELNRVTHEATQYAFSNCGAKKGERLTKEQVEKAQALMFEKLMPWILHNLT